VPYGTYSILDPFQALNCLATFIQSLSGQQISLTSVRKSDDASRNPFEDDDEDEDDCENEWQGVTADC
jgi:hypothetical protein